MEIVAAWASCCSPGPPGSGITPTFGSLYGFDFARSTVQNVNIEFDFPGPVSNTIADPATNSITVSTSGTYEISADLENCNPSYSSARYEINRNNVPIAGSIFSSQASGTVAIGKTIHISLNAGDIITVVPQFAEGTPQYSVSSLTVNHIST